MFRDPPIILLAVGQTLQWAGIFYIFPALLLRWEQDLGWSKADLTAAITIAVLVSALASPLAGKIIDHGKGPAMLAGSAVLGGAGLLILAAVAARWQFYAVWVLIGVAIAGCLYEPCFALVTRARGKNAKQGIILITLVAGFASTISYPVTYALAEHLGWRGACVTFSAVVVLVAAPITWVGAYRLEQSRKLPDAPPSAAAAGRGFLGTRTFWFLALAFSCTAMAHGAALHHLLPLLDEREIPPQTAVLAASFIGPMQVAGRLAVMASGSYLSHNAVAVLTFCVLGLAVLMLLASGISPAFLLAFVVFFGSAWGAVSILRPLLARDILGEEDFGAKFGALALPFLAGSALAPFLGSLIWEAGGYDALLIVVIGVTGVGLGLYLVANRAARTGRDRGRPA